MQSLDTSKGSSLLCVRAPAEVLPLWAAVGAQSSKLRSPCQICWLCVTWLESWGGPTFPPIKSGLCHPIKVLHPVTGRSRMRGGFMESLTEVMDKTQVRAGTSELTGCGFCGWDWCLHLDLQQGRAMKQLKEDWVKQLKEDCLGWFFLR